MMCPITEGDCERKMCTSLGHPPEVPFCEWLIRNLALRKKILGEDEVYKQDKELLLAGLDDVTRELFEERLQQALDGIRISDAFRRTLD